MPNQATSTAPALGSADFLIARLHRTVRDHVEGPLAEAGFSLKAHWVLTCLLGEEPQSQQQVCNALAIDRSDMVRLVDELEERGLLTRTRDKKDRRKHTLALTKAGRAAQKLCDAAVNNALDSALQPLSRDERTTFHHLAGKALGLGERTPRKGKK
ncbi:winged helix-turn-helix transcriptional regulator [Hoyosella rhizosphaerae]|uniref:MarR family winged helix-turn-helix transcriptional regulator n=1 Tax=Hoyosella rhizosphaerae TaxID=1755582 RepID=UPI00166D19C7|nr:MarR family winged helix-turn-helix transcriptional regulator [Hoyosella rhizosphaerae]MBN4925331.1 winged helix-turn-helix transcriptional regulator [Hoyosella rhizosphaerae]